MRLLSYSYLYSLTPLAIFGSLGYYIGAVGEQRIKKSMIQIAWKLKVSIVHSASINPRST
jgi:hypothetical protein